MDHGDETEEQLKITAVNQINYTPVAENIDWCVSQVDCHCQWLFLNYLPMNPNCHLSVVPGEVDNPVGACLLSSVNIYSSTCCVNTDGGKQQ